MALGRNLPPPPDEHDLLAQLHGGWAPPVPRSVGGRSDRASPRRAAPARTHRAPRVPPRLRADYTDRLLAEGFVLLLAYGMWLLNAYFTVRGLMVFDVPWMIGLLVHIGISKGEHHLWKGQLDLVALLLVLIFVAVDVGTTLLGVLQFVAERQPDLLGSLPVDVWQWGALFSAPRPEWAATALALLLLSAFIALSAEYLMKKFWQRFAAIWNGMA